jgi:hypothetical protein
VSKPAECNGICVMGSEILPGGKGVAYPHPDCDLHGLPATYGKCLACGSVEVRLNKVTCHVDLSDIGESDSYPAGYGCEVCS